MNQIYGQNEVLVLFFATKQKFSILQQNLNGHANLIGYVDSSVTLLDAMHQFDGISRTFAQKS